ncbi:hypothetical protein N9Y26_01040 [bacterium]|nr:hypothetical protein [bacterium]
MVLEAKRKAIGNKFIDIFDDEAHLIKDVKWLAQGNLATHICRALSGSKYEIVQDWLFQSVMLGKGLELALEQPKSSRNNNDIYPFRL